MSAQVTEGHRELLHQLLMNVEHGYLKEAAQLIADSEAKATERANAQVESLISSAKNAIPASEHPAESTVENWAWQMRNLGDDRRLVAAERDQLRAEVERLNRDYDYDHKCLHEVRERCELWKQRAERAEASLHALRLVCGTTDADKFSTWVDRANARAEKAEAELAKAKAVLASIEEDGTEEHNTAVRLRQELAAERARLDWLESIAGEDYQLGTHYLITRAAIDAAMKEGSA